jgi:hypothetical protein
MMVVAVSPTEQLLQLIPPKQTIKNASGFKPDFTLHEAGHFCTLLLGGDPRIVEL